MEAVGLPKGSSKSLSKGGSSLSVSSSRTSNHSHITATSTTSRIERGVSSVFEGSERSDDSQEDDFEYCGSGPHVPTRGSLFVLHEVYTGFRGRLCALLESHTFTVIIGFLIVTNVPLMIYETDHNASCANHADMSECKNDHVEVLNYIFLGIYTVEVAIRIYVFRFPLIFRSTWNCLDMVVVITGFVDVWLQWLALEEMPGPSMALLRILRVLRLLRAVRIFRKIPELHAMLRGFISAMRSMFWGLVMVVVVMILFSILCVELIHPFSLEIHEDNQYCKEAFGNIWYCIILFFQTLVAGDSWGDCMVPIIKEQWWTFLIFGTALACVQLGFLNLILAVIVQRASQAAQEDEEEVRREKIRLERKATHKLHNLFASIDTDESGTISLDEIMNGFDTSEELKHLFGNLDMNRHDVAMLFELMDTWDEGELSYDYLVENLRAALHGNAQMSLRMLRLQASEIARNVKTVRRESCARKSIDPRYCTRKSYCARTASNLSGVYTSEGDVVPSDAAAGSEAASPKQVPKAAVESNLQAESERSEQSDPQAALEAEIKAFRARLNGELLEVRSNIGKMNESVVLACQANFAYQSNSIQRMLDLMGPKEAGLRSAASAVLAVPEAELRSAAPKPSSEVAVIVKNANHGPAMSAQTPEQCIPRTTAQPDPCFASEVTDGSLTLQVRPQARTPSGRSMGSVAVGGRTLATPITGTSERFDQLASGGGPRTPRQEAG